MKHLVLLAGLLLAAALAGGCVTPDSYPHDNPYDPYSGDFLLTCSVDAEGVTLAWNPPTDTGEDDRVMIHADDDLNGIFTEVADVLLISGRWIDVRAIDAAEEIDYFLREPGGGQRMSNYVRCGLR